jgi:hypothetical protein
VPIKYAKGLEVIIMLKTRQKCKFFGNEGILEEFLQKSNPFPGNPKNK